MEGKDNKTENRFAEVIKINNLMLYFSIFQLQILLYHSSISLPKHQLY